MAKTKQLDFVDGFDLSNATDEVLDRYSEFLMRRDEQEDLRRRSVAAFKTVETFSGLIGRRMTLVPAKSAYTDGMVIGAPLDHEYAYEMVEHEISHNLFKSNFEAKTQFCDQYVLQVSKALSAFGVTMNGADQIALGNMVGIILNIIEDHRVNSLWAMLYPGSYKRLLEYSRSIVEKKRKQAHSDLVSYFLCVAYAAKVPPGVYDRYGPAMVTALKKVENKGPGATFVVGKWLMTQVVSEIIRIQKNLPPPPKTGTSTVKTDIDEMPESMMRPGTSASDSDGDSDGDDQEAHAGDGSGGTGGDDADADADADASGGAGAGESSDGGGGDGADWNPPPVQATAEERVDAFKKMLEAATKTMTDGSPMKQAIERVSNGRPSHSALSPQMQGLARQQVGAAYNTDVTNEKAMQDYLKQSASEMEKVVEAIRDALEEERKQTEQGWTTRGITAKVKFKEITKRRVTPPPLPPEDRRAVARMREVFQRVKSRATKVLAEDGTEVDIPAMIQRRASDYPTPIFKADVTGRGFKALVLVDRSSSMEGHRSFAAERAARILRAALKQPNVYFHVWGFHGGHDANVVLSRVAPNLDIADATEMPAHGNTPMAEALHAAVNFLTEGAEKKQLILLTDGEPNGSTDAGPTGDGKDDGKARYSAVRREVQRARRNGINVTTLVIGTDIPRDRANMMFGDERQWKRVKEGAEGDALAKALVQVVSTSFSRYLQNG